MFSLLIVIYSKGEYWYDDATCRSILTDFANKTGFDPTDPENWYPLTSEAFKDQVFFVEGTYIWQYLFVFQPAEAVLDYKGGLISSLIRLFPELPWDKTKFDTYKPRVDAVPRMSHK